MDREPRRLEKNPYARKAEHQAEFSGLIFVCGAGREQALLEGVADILLENVAVFDHRRTNPCLFLRWLFVIGQVIVAYLEVLLP